MRFYASPLISFSVFCTAFVLLSPSSAHATTGKKYAALRNRLQCDQSLTYETVSQKPSQFGGAVLELHGTIGGLVGSNDSLSVLFNLLNGGAVSLDVPPSEVETVRLYPSASLRVLVLVSPTPYSNLPLLTVKAIALETEVSPIDRQEQENARAREATRRARSRDNARSYLTRAGTRGTTSSRGGTTRSTANVPMSGDLKALESFYAPFLNSTTLSMFAPYATFIANHNRKIGVPKAAEIAANLLRFSWRSKVDPRLVVAMIVAESDFDPNSTSRTGAAGLGQLMPGTAQSLGVSNPYDVGQNLDGSITYLRSRLDTFADKAMPDGGLSFEQIRLAMAAYNAGVGAVKKYGGVPPYRETQAYVKRIEKLYRELCGV